VRPTGTGGRCVLNRAKGVETATVGKLQVEQHDVDPAFREPRQRRRQPLEVFDLEDGLPGVGQKLADEQRVIRTVFDEQHVNHLPGHCWRCRPPWVDSSCSQRQLCRNLL